MRVLGGFGRGAKIDRDSIRAALAAGPRRSPRRPSGARIEVDQSVPRADAVVPAAFGVIFLGLSALMAAMAGRANIAWWGILPLLGFFGGMGLFLLLIGLNLWRSRDCLLIASDRLSYTRRRLAGVSSFDEVLSSYLCLIPLVRRSSSRYHSSLHFYARLIHADDPSRDIALSLGHEEGSAGSLPDRKGLEELARSLDLPLASLSWDGMVSIRNPESLDEPLRLSSVPELGPFAGRRFRVDMTDDGFTASRGHLGWLIPALLFAVGFFAVLAVPFDMEARVSLGMGSAVFALIMMGMALTWSRLSLGGGRLECVDGILGMTIRKKSIPLARIEEIVDGREPGSGLRALTICADEGCIAWAEGCGASQIAWFKAAIECGILMSRC